MSGPNYQTPPTLNISVFNIDNGANKINCQDVTYFVSLNYKLLNKQVVGDPENKVSLPISDRK